MAEEALAHAQANWNLVANGDELLELPLQQLNTLLSSEQLKVDNEAQVIWFFFFFLNIWLIRKIIENFEIMLMIIIMIMIFVIYICKIPTSVWKFKITCIERM